MTYIATTWITTSVARIKPDYVIVYRKPNGAQCGIDANMVLTQMSDCGGRRRTVLGVIDTNTCEVIAAPDFDGFEGLTGTDLWRSRPVRISLAGLGEGVCA